MYYRQSSKNNQNAESINLHAKHRSRLKERFRKDGLENFEPHNVLELLLFYGLPRIDTNELAHELINKFGSFDAVLEAPYEALTQVKGIGPESATFLTLILQIFRYYNSCKDKERKIIADADAAKKYLMSRFIGVNVEKLVVVYLDGRGGMITTTEFTQKQDSKVAADFEAILKTCVLIDAKAIILAHNHPNGFATPSAEDKALTEDLSRLCSTLGIVLCDHLIFSGKDVCFLSKTRGIKHGTCSF